MGEICEHVNEGSSLFFPDIRGRVGTPRKSLQDHFLEIFSDPWVCTSSYRNRGKPEKALLGWTHFGPGRRSPRASENFSHPRGWQTGNGANGSGCIRNHLGSHFELVLVEMRLGVTDESANFRSFDADLSTKTLTREH